jgi:hypothetical protein
LKGKLGNSKVTGWRRLLGKIDEARNRRPYVSTNDDDDNSKPQPLETILSLGNGALYVKEEVPEVRMFKFLLYLM